MWFTITTPKLVSFSLPVEGFAGMAAGLLVFRAFESDRTKPESLLTTGVTGGRLAAELCRL